jgi:hypothetical protein
MGEIPGDYECLADTRADLLHAAALIQRAARLLKQASKRESRRL